MAHPFRRRNTRGRLTQPLGGGKAAKAARADRRTTPRQAAHGSLRAQEQGPDGGIGRHKGLKIPHALRMSVRVRLRAPHNKWNKTSLLLSPCKPLPRAFKIVLRARRLWPGAGATHGAGARRKAVKFHPWNAFTFLWITSRSRHESIYERMWVRASAKRLFFMAGLFVSALYPALAFPAGLEKCLSAPEPIFYYEKSGNAADALKPHAGQIQEYLA